MKNNKKKSFNAGYMTATHVHIYINMHNTINEDGPCY